MVSLKLMTSLAFQCLRYIFLRNYLNIQYQWVFLSYIHRLLLKKSPCTSAPQSIWIAPHYGGDFLFYIIPNLFVYLPARSLDDFMSLTKATRKNPHEWRTPLTNALLNNNEKQTRKARQLSFVNPWASFSVLFDSSSSHRRAFSFFAILKKMWFVALCFSAK